MSQFTALSDIYREFGTLFREHAQLHTISVDDVLAAIGTEPLPTSKAKELLSALNNLMLRAPELNSQMREAILSAQLIPSTAPTGALACLRDCYLPDNQTLRDLFMDNSLVTVANLEVNEVAKLEALFEALGLQNRYLSVAVQSRTDVAGRQINQAETRDLCQKALWACKLSDKPTEEMLGVVLQTQVWNAQSISVKYFLEDAVAEQPRLRYKVEMDDDRPTINLSPEVSHDDWLYIQHEFASVLAAKCAVKRPICVQLIPTLLRMPLNSLPDFLCGQDIKDINRGNFELVDSWIAQHDQGDEAKHVPNEDEPSVHGEEDSRESLPDGPIGGAGDELYGEDHANLEADDEPPEPQGASEVELPADLDPDYDPFAEEADVNVDAEKQIDRSSRANVAPSTPLPSRRRKTYASDTETPSPSSKRPRTQAPADNSFEEDTVMQDVSATAGNNGNNDDDDMLDTPDAGGNKAIPEPATFGHSFFEPEAADHSPAQPLTMGQSDIDRKGEVLVRMQSSSHVDQHINRKLGERAFVFPSRGMGCRKALERSTATACCKCGRRSQSA